MIDTIKTYKINGKDFIAKFDPTRIAGNVHGVWYEHPIFGDESPLVLIANNVVYLTSSYEVLGDEYVEWTLA